MAPSEIEQTKLFANALDRASTTFVTVGVATPIAGFIYNVGNFGTLIEPWRLFLGIGAWLAGALALHYLARRTLRRLDQ